MMENRLQNTLAVLPQVVVKFLNTKLRPNSLPRVQSMTCAESLRAESARIDD